MKLSVKEQPIMAWLKEIEDLIDVKKLYESNQSPIMHGRLVLIGLSLLDPPVKEHFEQIGIFSALIKEIREPLREILTERGRILLDEKTREPTSDIPIQYSSPPQPNEPLESVPNQPDEPLQRIGDDQLGRAAFARFLAKRIESVPKGSGAYSLHIHGPWGSGKSTLLNFVKFELESSGWIVTEFNAWRNQHIRPPWWSLLNSVFQQTKKELSVSQRLAEFWWRFNTGRIHYILGLAVIIWIAVLFVFPRVHSSPSSSLGTWSLIADNLSKIVALVLTVWGIVTAVSQSLLFGSSKAAKTFMELTRDPMESIKMRFTKMLERLEPKRTIVFIDDLDRCQGSYVIELLEGIQTLFKDAPVVFVIAADRQWLNACYEQSYKEFKPLVCEPGKPMGTLFLEKVFQFCTPVPAVPQELKQAFWERLIKVKDIAIEPTLTEARQNARNMMDSAGHEGAVLRFVDESKGKPFYEQLAIREEAVVRLAAREVIERTEHSLKPFGPFLDANPRSMKRLVNAYSVNRALVTLSNSDIKREPLAWWTIMALRWPVLTDYLGRNPEKFDQLASKNISGLPEDIAKLCSVTDVIQLLEASGSWLNADVIRKCAVLQM